MGIIICSRLAWPQDFEAAAAVDAKDAPREKESSHKAEEREQEGNIVAQFFSKRLNSGHCFI